MSSFQELIKIFGNSRDYVRDFFVYGFKSREDFTAKSARTYDNERRRLVSWLSAYVREDYTKNGKNISLSIDSNLLDTNPLYEVWKTKSFTDRDIMLHFFLLDYLKEHPSQTINMLTDGCMDTYEVLLDAQAVRRKCVEYVKEGLMTSQKCGKELQYSIAPDFGAVLMGYPTLKDAVCLYQLYAPLGFVGNHIMDSLSMSNTLFRIKHNFFVHTLEDEVLYPILQAMHQGYVISILSRSTKNGNEQHSTGIPVKILTSTRTGRRFVCIYTENKHTFFCMRMDGIKEVKLLSIYPEYASVKERFAHTLPHLWGVSFQNGGGDRLQHLSMTLQIHEESEGYILNRLKREGKGGKISKLEEHVYQYEIEVYDLNEMLPWIRTFTGRIMDLQSSSPSFDRKFQKDLAAMYSIYDIDILKG